MKNILTITLLGILLGTSCTVTDSPYDYSKAATSTAVEIGQTSVETKVSSAIPVEGTPDYTNQQIVKSAKIIKTCPDRQIVSFKELNLPDNFRLIALMNTIELYPQIPSKPYSISSVSVTPTPIINDDVFTFQVSLDHKWIYYTRPNQENKFPVLWVSSIDGKENFPVIELGGKGYSGYANWSSDQEILIIGSPREDEISSLDAWEYMPFMSVNPFTLEKRRITYLAEKEANKGLYYYGAFGVDNHSLGMFGRLNRVDFIYDFEQDKSYKVFSWLDSVNPSEMQLMPPVWVYDNGKFAVTVAQSDGFDLAFNLDIQSAGETRSYNDIMRRIVLPEYLLPASVLGIVPVKNLIAIQRLDFFNPNEGANWFYTYDNKNGVVYDYCFDLGASIKQIKFSPDGRFVALSLDGPASDTEQAKNYIAILSLENGKIVYVKGYSLADWGVVP